MPKPLLKPQQQTETLTEGELRLSATNKRAEQQKQKLDKMQLDRLLRKSRSKEYMEAIHRLDAGGHVHNQHKVDELLDAIRKEFPEVELAGILIGIVSKCYLGVPYEVHTIDMAGCIIEHYKKGESLPNGLERARAIAIRGGYDFIEVYIDCIRAVSADGSVSVITG